MLIYQWCFSASLFWAPIWKATLLSPSFKSCQAVHSSLQHDNSAIVNCAWVSFPLRVKMGSSCCLWLVSSETIQSQFLSAPHHKSKAKEPKPPYHAEPYANPASLSLRIKIHHVFCEISPHKPSVKCMVLLKIEPFHNSKNRWIGTVAWQQGF